MFAALTVVGFIFAFAWVQQQFFNRLIEADRRMLLEGRYKPSDHHSDTDSP